MTRFTFRKPEGNDLGWYVAVKDNHTSSIRYLHTNGMIGDCVGDWRKAYFPTARSAILAIEQWKKREPNEATLTATEREQEMMKQRKLMAYEIDRCNEAIGAITQVREFSTTVHIRQLFELTLLAVKDMKNSGTTDGKPYVDPEPPKIPDGYRKWEQCELRPGTKMRSDIMYWNIASKKWVSKSNNVYHSDTLYIVPVDRIPTDEEAAVFPRIQVMVQDNPSTIGPWRKETLLAVKLESDYPFVTSNGNWAHCRHLHPGE